MRDPTADLGLPAGVRQYLRVLTTRLRDGLGPHLVAGFLTGSAAFGAFDAETSDLDVAAVCADETPPGELARLVERIRHRALPCPARGLEFVLYPLATAAAAGSEPGFVLELNDGPRMPFRTARSYRQRATSDPGAADFWYVIDRSILRAHGRSLLGGSPAEVVAEPPHDAVRASLAASVQWYLDAPRRGAAPAVVRDGVLNACRGLIWAATGEWTSKPEAGRRSVQWQAHPVVAEVLAGAVPPAGAVRGFLQEALEQLQQGDHRRRAT